MALRFHPQPGTIVICDYKGFEAPEMIKRRPAIVISPRFRDRLGLCTIVPCSTTVPKNIMPYHYEITLDQPMSEAYPSIKQWVKCDMLATVGFSRLSLPHNGKDSQGKRLYVDIVIPSRDLDAIRQSVMHAIGL
ncbi:MAG TPA: type II toxin-antitoxin system PemK/MazF family toxin [Halothiobacillus sp.]|nr:type II toxin-antitoxin system PemK/MazF family toxin [Halothiobacillus sp.]